MRASLSIAAVLALATPAWSQQEPMPLYGVTAAAQGVTFRIPMSACHARSDFTVAVLKRQPSPMLLLAPRHEGDCTPSGAGHLNLTYGFNDLGLTLGQAFVLGNPLISEP